MFREVVAGHEAEALRAMRDPFERVLTSALGARLHETGVELTRLRVNELRVGAPGDG